MGQQDISEKKLLSHNKLFANICNVAIFDGEEVIKPDKLQDEPTELPAKEGDKQTIYHRDLAKLVKIDTETGCKIAMIALENQTDVNPEMVLRCMNYDVLSYRRQFQQGASIGQLFPVKTIVLYFGKSPWTAKTSLHEILDIPEKMRPLIPNYFIDVLDMGRLTAEKLEKLHNDLRTVAEYIQYSRRGETFYGNAIPLEYPKQTIDVICAIAGDNEFKKVYNEALAQGKGQIVMCEMTKKIREEGWVEGKAAGMQQGMQQGRAEGKAEGITEGLLKGQLKEKFETARKMLKEGLTLDIILKCTGLSLEEIQALAAQAV